MNLGIRGVGQGIQFIPAPGQRSLDHGGQRTVALHQRGPGQASGAGYGGKRHSLLTLRRDQMKDRSKNAYKESGRVRGRAMPKRNAGRCKNGKPNGSLF